jgi:hypothetical protein
MARLRGSRPPVVSAVDTPEGSGRRSRPPAEGA